VKWQDVQIERICTELTQTGVSKPSKETVKVVEYHFQKHAVCGCPLQHTLHFSWIVTLPDYSEAQQRLFALLIF
jgi:hypothetical protein